jgi:DNA polymerase sigma
MYFNCTVDAVCYRLLRTYVQADERCRMLVYLIKHWAKVTAIHCVSLLSCQPSMLVLTVVLP